MLDLKKIENVPQSLKDLKQWICWKAVERDGRETKMPVNAMTGAPAKSNDPETWTDFESACDYAAGSDVNGLGFVFASDDGLVGIDLDVCISEDGRTIEEWALVILHKFASYAEISPSGRGLKIWCRGTIPKGYKINLGEKDLPRSARRRGWRSTRPGDTSQSRAIAGKGFHVKTLCRVRNSSTG